MTTNKDFWRPLLRWLWRHAWLLLPLLALPAVWPLLARGLTASADGELHLFRMMALGEQIRKGVLFPRWVPELYTGLGYPLFNYYAPLSYYPGILLHALGFSYASSLVLSFCILILAGGLGTYRLALDIFGERFRGAALVAAVAYMLTPYLLTNVYVRGAIAEVTAQALLPWIFWSVRRLLTSQEPIDYLVPTVLTLGALAVTHNITLILLPPAILGYGFVLWWQEGKQRQRLLWTALAFGMAAGVSAFFWLPVAAERTFVFQQPFAIARDTFIPENVWRWRNFLDTTFTFDYSFAIPFQLGLVQVALAAAGLVIARRKDPEWLFLLVLAITACLFIGAWSLPFWQSNDLLLAVQFPWRLLSIASLPLALFIGGTASRSQPVSRQIVVSAGVILVLIIANFPRTNWMGLLQLPTDPAPAALAKFEFQSHALGTTFMQEFQPRWAFADPQSETTEDGTTDQLTVSLEKANRFGLQATIDSPAGGALRLGSFYFPGWRITADGVELRPYPSTEMGLLTVDVPPHSQRLRVEWKGTGVQEVGVLLSLLTLLGLSILVGRRARRRWLAIFPATLLVLGTIMAWWRPPLTAIQTPQAVVETEDLSLLGYQLTQLDSQHLIVYPYWYVRHTPSAATRVKWQVRDNAGDVVAEQIARSHFNSFPFHNWPPGTVVDDAYLISLPPGLPASAYDISVQILSDTESKEAPATKLASVELETPPSEGVAIGQPTNQTDAEFGHGMSLIGYDVLINGTHVAAEEMPLAKPGDFLTYELYWQATEPLQEDYHAFVHLVNSKGKLLVQDDHPAGSAFSPPTYWSLLDIQRDPYILQIPWEARNAVFWPIVGAYKVDAMEHLPVQAQEGTTLGDSYRLAAIKVLSNPTAPEPAFSVGAKLGEEIDLLGYDLEPAQSAIRPGDSITLTLHFQGRSPIAQDLTRFVHLYNLDLGMAGQVDSKPSNGSNPTWAWIPGEVVLDKVVLTLPDSVPPGRYSLLAGLYDPATAERLPVQNRDGTAQSDGTVHLTELLVER